MQTYAVIPAAGRSRRMGQPKSLMPWGDTSVIEHVLAVWRASRADRVIVVVDPRDDRLAHVCRSCGAPVVVPDEPPAEMKDSVRLGLEWIESCRPHGDDAFLVAPADMPTLKPEVIDRLIAAHADTLERGAEPCILVPRHGTRRGHPVLFPWPLAAEVAQLGPGQGLNALVERHRVEFVEAGAEAISEDFDTPEDYERLRARFDR